MRRKEFTLLVIRGLILASFFAAARQGMASSPPATLKAISLPASGSSNQLQLRIDGEYSYKALQATPDTLFVDLESTKADRIAKNGEWSGGSLTGYHLLQYTNSKGQPVVRVQVEMKHHQAYQVQRTVDGLLFSFGDNPNASPSSMNEQPAPPSVLPVAAKPVETDIRPAKSSRGPVQVSGVTVVAGPNGEAFIDVATTQPAQYRVLQLNNPRRLVLDVDGAHQSLHQKTILAQSPLLSAVRIAQFQEKNPPVVRVVADLSGEPIFDVHAQPGGVRIALKPHMAASHAAPPAMNASVPAPPKVADEKPVGSLAESQPSKAAAEAAGGATTAARVEPEAAKIAQTQPQAVAPTHSEYQNALPPSAAPKQVSAAPSPESLEPTTEAVAAAHAAKVLGASMETNPQAAEGQVPASVGINMEQSHYTGDPISLNLKDVDLKDFFRLIHEISGLNILVDPDVTGSVTTVLDNVPWDQALDIVLKNNGLGKSFEGNVLRISRVQTLTAEQESATKLVAARDDAQPLVTQFVVVNYAKATAISTLLKSWLGGGALTKRGTVLVDDRTNTVIVSDIASQIPVIMQIIRKLDTKSKQISIEARVVLASKTFSRDLQGALNNGIVNHSGTTVTGGAVGTGASVTGNIPTASGTGPRITIGQTSAAGFGAYAISNEGARYFINAMLAAAESKTQAKTISQPIIVTQNNVKGTVVQGVQIPVQTTVNLTVTTVYFPAALTLIVTPQVTADGNVFMIIEVDNSSLGAILPSGPSINTQSATTQVLVPDGGTVIFGGVTINGSNQSATYVPLLGEIPILGHLFKSTTRTTNDSELLFFVSPKVLPD